MTAAAATAAATALRRARAALEEHGLDALVASSPESVAHLAGTSFMTQVMIPDRLALVVVAATGDPVFVYCTIEDGSARAESWLTNLRGYVEHAEPPAEVLADVVREQGVARGRIGLEGRHLSHRDWSAVQRALPEAELVEADAVFDRLRAIKTPEEVDAIAAAAFATDAAIRAAFGRAGPGTTEREVAEALVGELRARGGERLLHLVLATGENNLKTHAEPGDAKLQPGGVLRTDVGMSFGRFKSDVARTAFVGPLSARQERWYRALEDGQQALIAAMRPGVTAASVFHATVAAFADSGVDFWVPHVGHSFGLGLHEQPMLHPYDETVLEPGMVFMVEPAFATEEGLYHTEDMVEITEDGNRVHTRSADWSEPLVLS